ncbi:hypothetical protein BDW74DRAFT_135158 [Aspergillus multicolor]|uniref:uncharacterized protein n=1 Tax=Aspergillus multicolor TaxID=41759 RepID=UPI003CCDF851
MRQNECDGPTECTLESGVRKTSALVCPLTMAIVSGWGVTRSTVYGFCCIYLFILPAPSRASTAIADKSSHSCIISLVLVLDRKRNHPQPQILLAANPGLQKIGTSGFVNLSDLYPHHPRPWIGSFSTQLRQ